MTERERWIIYPLLLLALGVSLRDRLVKTAPPAQSDTARVQREELRAQRIVQCEELRTHRIVVVEPKQSRPCMVLDTAPETQTPGALHCGRIELSDSAGRHQTAIARGKIQSDVLAGHELFAVDPFGQVRAAIGSRADGPSDGKSARPATSGVVQVFSHNGVPAVHLGADAEGGVVVARHENRPFAIVVGNLPKEAGVFAQHGRDPVVTTSLAMTVPKKEIIKLPKLELPAPGPTKPAAKDAETKTPPAMQPTVPAIVPSESP
jgi:hypothetical protein